MIDVAIVVDVLLRAGLVENVIKVKIFAILAIEDLYFSLGFIGLNATVEISSLNL